VKPYKEICRCEHHISWHGSNYLNKKGSCNVGVWYSVERKVCPCKEYIPRDNLEYLEMKACE